MTQPTKLVVCPTSHMDWDWISSFEEYYKIGTGEESQVVGPVQQILDAAVGLAAPGFRYSLAELAWLRRYLIDSPQSLAVLAPSLSLLGGGWVSPDNLVCDGEVFVRNYLVGRTWARAAGLGALLESVSWLPDDFGHDPELPIILSAMGLTAVGLARVPGAFPNYNAPLSSGGAQPPSMACALMSSGLAFRWQAADGSTVFAHFMPDTYGVPFTSGGDECNAEAWNGFVESSYIAASYPTCAKLPAALWPGDIAFAPAGGDFAIPDSGWTGGVTTFNQDQATTAATIGTFSDYIQAVVASGAQLITQSLDPSNFWTGYFGSRPALKRLQAAATRALVAAEAASSLLWLSSPTSSTALAALDGAIADAWYTLVPSAHHDFITGTSPDRVYKMEQLPRLSLAVSQARAALTRTLQWLADMVSLTGSAKGQVVAVFNPIGGARAGVARLDRSGTVSFDGTTATTQLLGDGGMLVAVPSVPGLAYLSGTLAPATGTEPRPPADVVGDVVTIDSGTLAITVARASAWAITSIVPAGGSDVMPTGQVANALQLYGDSGNLYQYGNEPNAGGQFSLQAGALTAGPARLTERGPLRWRIEAEVTGPAGRVYHLRYTLLAGEALIRMEVTGEAPAATTVVTTFPAIATDGKTAATRLLYGTAHHYHLDDAPAYWTGPVFKATHDFLMPSAPDASATFALAAIYHAGTPAWACTGGQLLGSLFRNTDGQQRGAAGTDSDTHTQRYALRISTTALDPGTGQVLLEALQFAQPLLAAVATPANQPECPITLGAAGFVASADTGTLIRIARPVGVQPSAAGTTPGAVVALRLYRPAADGTPTTVHVTLGTSAILAAVLVTALEEPIADAPAVTFSGNVLQVPTTGALTTVLVTVARPTSTPWNGKDYDPNCS